MYWHYDMGFTNGLMKDQFWASDRKTKIDRPDDGSGLRGVNSDGDEYSFFVNEGEVVI